MNTNMSNKQIANTQPSSCVQSSDQFTPSPSHERPTNVMLSKIRLDSPVSVPPPPPPTRATSTPINSATFQIMNSGISYVAPFFIPRIIPEFRSTSVLPIHATLARRSGIRGTLKSFTGPGQAQPCHTVLTEPIHPASSSSTALGLTPSDKPIGELLKTARYIDEQNRKNIREHEKDAAIALLVLKECSANVSDMASYWSDVGKIPLCDFVVAQRKCQTMLDNIETLKDIKIQAREQTAVDETANDKFVERCKSARQKNMSFYRERSKALSSRSSSIVSIINVNKKGDVNKARSSSSSSERTLTRSPLSSEATSPPPLPFPSPPRPPTPSSSNGVERKSLHIFVGATLSDQDKKHQGKVGKTSKSGKNRNTHMRCLHCSATDTPEWRKGPVGPTTLCNACGLFYKKLIRKFGDDTADVIMKARQIDNPHDRKVPKGVTS